MIFPTKSKFTSQLRDKSAASSHKAT